MARYEQGESHEVWHVGPAAQARLATLGLTEADLEHPLYLALADATLCTDLDAPGAAGYLFWTRSNRYLRERLAPQGWTWTNRDNVLRTIDPAGQFTVTAMSATGAVGVQRGQVQTRNPKGSVVATLVRYNYSLYGGPRNQYPIPGTEVPEQFEPGMLPTWFLLYRVTSEGIQRELSLPVDMLGSVVNKWREHILLTTMPFPEGGSAVGGLDIFNGPDDQGPDVPVERIA
ncbi:hypothetical protein ACIBSW_07120 [Actinoplanes sp. NPDC049668]|uniref:hypothetical protein n=1 Tax=unclassified Actinoplanes TaxID=2626549 RepID=UPI0033BA3CE2